MVYGARGRREAMWQLAELRGRLTAAEDALADALAAMKRAEEAFDGASDRFDAAESVLDVVREARALARQERYAARQAHERASTNVDRLQRRVGEMSERLDRMAELAPAHKLCRTRVLIMGVSVERPPWWWYPKRCANGHEWRPGAVTVGFERCDCAPVRELFPERGSRGHLSVACREPGCRSVWYFPPHNPGSAAPGRNDGASPLAGSCNSTEKLLDWANDPAVAAAGQW